MEYKILEELKNIGVTQEQFEKYCHVTEQQKQEHFKNLYDFMIVFGYKKPEEDIFKLIKDVSCKENFYDFYVNINKLIKNNVNPNIIYKAFEAIIKLNFLENKNCIEGFLYLEQFVIECWVEYFRFSSYVEKESEFQYEKRVIENFDNIFPNYKFFKNQVIVKNLGKIDILAKEKNTNRDVIIELKIDNTNPKRQLLAYGGEYENPILVALTKEECCKKHHKIIYKVWK